MQVEVKTLMNRTQPIPGFIYASVALKERGKTVELWVDVEAHLQRPARCSVCEKPAPTYDHLPQRAWVHVPISDFLISAGINQYFQEMSLAHIS